MKKIKGDLIELAEKGDFDVIIHGCNCFCSMDAGIAKSIKLKFPEAYEADLKTIKGDRSKLGSISYVEVEIIIGKLILVNGYTQYDWKGSGIKADYNAIRKVFKNVKEQFAGLRIGYPAIGAGLGGGNWDIIYEIIKQELSGVDHTFVEYQG